MSVVSNVTATLPVTNAALLKASSFGESVKTVFLGAKEWIVKAALYVKDALVHGWGAARTFVQMNPGTVLIALGVVTLAAGAAALFAKFRKPATPPAPTGQPVPVAPVPPAAPETGIAEPK